MDFSLSEDQQAVRELASTIMSDLSTPEHLKEVEATDSRFDEQLWSKLAGAGLIGLSLPESVGGEGLGFLETCVLAEEAGRTAAAIPLVATLVFGAAPIAAFGSETLQKRWLPGVVAGTTILSAGLDEVGANAESPVTSAVADGDGWRITGTKTCVMAGMLADAIVVSARITGGDTPGPSGGRVELFVVPCDAPGVSRVEQMPTTGHPEAEFLFDDVHVGADDLLRWTAASAGDAGADSGAGGRTLRWLLERAATALCVQEAGACKAAVEITARYTSERRQFGKPVAEFQAVGQRAADAYVDAEGVRLTAWQAAWRLDEDLPASAEVAVAKFWADDGAQRVVHGCQHLHGGVGVDRDYPVHRYFLMIKHLSLTLGGTAVSLLRLGDILASDPSASA
jgi:alkylation response protein AidB-like acyl-CoA dehydrogenase